MNQTASLPREDGELFFEEGIIGVPRARRFQVLEREGTPLRVLRSLDVRGFALPVADPRLADPSYRPEIKPRVAEALGLEGNDAVLVLAIATLEPEGPVVNLRAPLVINVARKVGAQVILDDRSLSLRAKIREEEAATSHL